MSQLNSDKDVTTQLQCVWENWLEHDLGLRRKENRNILNFVTLSAIADKTNFISIKLTEKPTAEHIIAYCKLFIFLFSLNAEYLNGTWILTKRGFDSWIHSKLYFKCISKAQIKFIVSLAFSFGICSWFYFKLGIVDCLFFYLMRGAIVHTTQESIFMYWTGFEGVREFRDSLKYYLVEENIVHSLNKTNWLN